MYVRMDTIILKTVEVYVFKSSNFIWATPYASVRTYCWSLETDGRADVS